MSITVPIPTTFEQTVWLAIGVMFGRAFCKKIDWDIQQSEWFKKQGLPTQNVISRVLDFSHHWWGGALLMLYAPPSWGIIAYWFGAGLLLDDLPDIPERINKILNSYKTPAVEPVTPPEVKPP